MQCFSLEALALALPLGTVLSFYVSWLTCIVSEEEPIWVLLKVRRG